MKYYDGMGKDVSGYVAGLEATVAELKAKLEAVDEYYSAKLELAPKASTLNLTSPDIVGSVETEVKPKPRRRTEPDANAE